MNCTCNNYIERIVAKSWTYLTLQNKRSMTMRVCKNCGRHPPKYWYIDKVADVIVEGVARELPDIIIATYRRGELFPSNISTKNKGE